MSTSHESTNEEECDARGSTESIKVQSNEPSSTNLEDSILGPGNWIRKIENRLARLPEDPRGRPKDEFHSIAVAEDALH